MSLQGMLAAAVWKSVLISTDAGQVSWYDTVALMQHYPSIQYKGRARDGLPLKKSKAVWRGSHILTHSGHLGPNALQKAVIVCSGQRGLSKRRHILYCLIEVKSGALLKLIGWQWTSSAASQVGRH